MTRAVVTSLAVSVSASVPMVSETRGACLIVGEGPELVIAAPTPDDLLAWLDRARALVLEAAPRLVPPAPGPHPLLVEARATVIEDILGRLGVEPCGMVREISDVAQADIRTARRMATQVVHHLDEVIDTPTSSAA